MRRSWREPVVAPAPGRWFAVALALGLLWLTTAAPSAASPTVPYSDPNAIGYIGLCDAQGHQLTSGSVNTAPFAWRAVSTTAAQGPYAGPTRTALLMAYQPIDGLAPSDWSGDVLTAASRYSNPANPMAAATGGDESLAGFMSEYSPKWDGILQLRMYLDAANEPVYSLHYPALDIQVTGSTWHALDGGPVDCHAGTAVSIESILLPASKLKTPPGSSSSTTAPGSSAARRRLEDPEDVELRRPRQRWARPHRPRRPRRTSVAANTPSSDHAGEWVAVAAIAALALLVIVVLARSRSRRQRAGGARTASDPTGDSAPTKDKDADRVPVPSTKGTTPVNAPLRRLARQAGLTLIASLLLLGGTVLSTVSWLGATPAGAATAPPWEPDPDAVGGLVFYNSSGTVITGGNVTDSPIAAYVEGTSTARFGDSVASLYGYLPVQGQPTSEWSGEQLGTDDRLPELVGAGATQHVHPAASRPGTRATRRCRRWSPTSPTTARDGYADMYQLRLYTNAPHHTQGTSYDAADILHQRNTGSTATWSLVYPTTPSFTSLIGRAGQPAGVRYARDPHRDGHSFVGDGHRAVPRGLDRHRQPGHRERGHGPCTDLHASGRDRQPHRGLHADRRHRREPVERRAVVHGHAGVDVDVAVGVAPQPPDCGTQETLTATVTPSSAPGTVQFMDGVDRHR